MMFTYIYCIGLPKNEMKIWNLWIYFCNLSHPPHLTYYILSTQFPPLHYSINHESRQRWVVTHFKTITNINIYFLDFIGFAKKFGWLRYELLGFKCKCFHPILMFLLPTTPPINLPSIDFYSPMISLFYTVCPKKSPYDFFCTDLPKGHLTLLYQFYGLHLSKKYFKVLRILST